MLGKGEWQGERRRGALGLLQAPLRGTEQEVSPAEPRQLSKVFKRSDMIKAVFE